MQGELKQVADLALFAKIVQTGGISRCAADLGMERTTISRRLGMLERSLGVKLLDRTPKQIVVTDAGRRCLQHCEQLLELSRNAQSLATIGEIVADTAPIAVGAPPDIIERFLEPLLADFEDSNPGLRIERRPISDWSDEIAESVDLGVALGAVPANVGWTNTIAYVRQSVYASSDYVAKRRPPKTPLDLKQHDCIVERANSDRPSWRFEHNGDVTTVSISAKFVVSGLLEAREATLAGLGVSRLPHYLCEPYLDAGRLVDLMPDATCGGRDVIVISPRRRQRKTGTAALRMHLETAFNNETL